MKRSRLIVIAGVLCALMLVGCSGGSNAGVSSGAESSGSSSTSEESQSESASGSESTETSSEEAEYEIISGDFTLDDCIVLMDYSGMDLTNTIYVATDDYINSYIESLAGTEEVTDENAVVEEGDVVNIAFEGRIDGETFEGGSSDAYDLTIGSDSFIDGFEDGLIGMKKGEETDLDLTFPEDYGNEEYAGVDVVFHVTINSINRTVEQDDSWVNEYTGNEYSSMDEFFEYNREMINEALKENSHATLLSDAWTAVYDGSEFLALPEKYVEEGKELLMSTLETESTAYGFESTDEYFEAVGMDETAKEEYINAYGEDFAKSRLIAEAIFEREGLLTDGEEVNAVMEELAAGYGMSVEQLIEEYGEPRSYLYSICTVANELVVEKANVTEQTEDYNV